MLEIKTNKGMLKYRMPNILEAYDLLDASGIYIAGTTSLKLKRNILASMGDMVDHKSVGYESYAEMLNDLDNMIAPLAEIADTIIERSLEVFKKKD